MREIYNTRITLSFDQKPLAEVAALISEQIGLPVVIDQLSLDDSGIDRSHALTGDFENLPLHDVMRLLLRPLDWACTYDPACLTLSSADEAELRLKVRVYPVGDLLNRDCLGYESLIDVTVSTVASETWAENGGGEAEIRPLVAADALIISQTAPIHLEIEELLGNIRWAMRVQKISPGGNPCAHAERWEKHPGMGGGAAASAWVRTGGWAAEGPIDEPSPSTDEDRSQSNKPTE